MNEITTFLNDMRSNNCSENTLISYKHHLNDIFNFIGSLENLNQESVRKYRLQKTNIKLSTLGYYLISLRSFLRWLLRNGYNVMSPEMIEIPKVHEQKLIFLNSSQIKLLVNLRKSVRDQAILEVFFSTGMRVSELVSLNRDFDVSCGEITILGKGKRCRLVFLSNAAIKAIKNYLKSRIDTNSALFVNKHNSKRISVRSVQVLIKDMAIKAKIPFLISPHTLRHSMATDLLRGGADLRSIQELLGHRSIATTQIYTHVTNQSLKRVFNQCHSNL